MGIVPPRTVPSIVTLKGFERFGFKNALFPVWPGFSVTGQGALASPDVLELWGGGVAKSELRAPFSLI